MSVSVGSDPHRGKTCETGFERFSEQLCCEGVRAKDPTPLAG
ncbi:hypothetical protein [Treponema sp.]|nr:hypothetical protein [Treponema sp.]